MPDRYTYPGSDVLINKYGITDYDHWKEAETDFIGARMFHLREHPLDGSYDLAHLQAVHAYLTQDMYSWGGEIRDTDTHPGGTGIAHCRPQFIVTEAERAFWQLASRDYLRGLNADAFSDGLAWVWGETTTGGSALLGCELYAYDLPPLDRARNGDRGVRPRRDHRIRGASAKASSSIERSP